MSAAPWLPHRCNISYLEEWLKDKNLQASAAKDTLEPLSQVAWLLQVKKTTDSDAQEIAERCTSLSTVQVTRWLRALGPPGQMAAMAMAFWAEPARVVLAACSLQRRHVSCGPFHLIST